MAITTEDRARPAGSLAPILGAIAVQSVGTAGGRRGTAG